MPSPTVPQPSRTGKMSRLPNGLEMSRLAANGDVPWPETSCGGPVPAAQDQLQGKDTPAGMPESIGLQLATGPGRPGRLHRVVGRPVPTSSKARPQAGGQRAQEGFGSEERASLAGDALQARGQSHSILDGPSRAYNGLEMSRPASQGKYRMKWLALAGRVGSIELLGGLEVLAASCMARMRLAMDDIDR